MPCRRPRSRPCRRLPAAGRGRGRAPPRAAARHRAHRRAGRDRGRRVVEPVRGRPGRRRPAATSTCRWRASGSGKLSYEILGGAEPRHQRPEFAITDQVAYVANLAAGASNADALAGPPAAPFPVRRKVRTRAAPAPGVALRPQVHGAALRRRAAAALRRRRARLRGHHHPPGPGRGREPGLHRHRALRRAADRGPARAGAGAGRARLSRPGRGTSTSASTPAAASRSGSPAAPR